MRALDSNILLRFITGDDSAQTSVARRFIADELTERDPGYVALPVLCEVVWALRRVYKFESKQVVEAVRLLMSAKQILVAEEVAVAAALESTGDFVDALIHELGRAAGCEETVTFDRHFARIQGVRLLSG